MIKSNFYAVLCILGILTGLLLVVATSRDNIALFFNEDKKSHTPKPQSHDQKISYVSQLIYTIQTGSFIEIISARKQFESIIKGLNGKELDYLRIEKVGKFYSVRLGKFEDYTAGEKVFKTIKHLFPSAIILKTHIKDERIVRLYRSPPKK